MTSDGSTPSPAVAGRRLRATGVAVTKKGQIWVYGTRRDAGDHGLDGFVRWYNPKGSLRNKLRIDRSERFLRTGGIESVGNGAVASAWVGTPYKFKGGRLWRLVGCAGFRRPLGISTRPGVLRVL